MYTWEVPEKMGDWIFRPLVLFLVGDVIQPFDTTGSGSKALGHFLLDGFLAIKSICMKFGTRKYIFDTLYFSLCFFPLRFKY